MDRFDLQRLNIDNVGGGSVERKSQTNNASQHSVSIVLATFTSE
jgi:hypothetical protein